MTGTRIVLHTDGGSRKKRRRREAAGAAIITRDEKVIIKKSWYFSSKTNNQAEYLALLNGLNLLLDNFRGKIPKEIICMSDSQLMIKQLRGEYKVRNQKLRQLFREIKKLELKFGNTKLIYVHVKREHRMIEKADLLLNQLLDKKEK